MPQRDPEVISVANATFCATLVDQWIVNGLDAAFVAPGSRSTPLALALAERSEIRLEIFHDERSASFAALGYGTATMKPAVILCTSGTAATHFHGAVAEAGTTCLPMLVCTANRPPELWGIGAPQTINQTNLYAASVRAFHQPGPPEESEPDGWRALANRSWLEAMGQAEPGPVQLDLSFREPLVGTAEQLPPDLAAVELRPPHGENSRQIDWVIEDLIDSGIVRPGVIVAGRGVTEPGAVDALARRLGWPVIADHRSGLRDGRALHAADTFLRGSSDLKSQTQRILRFGEPLSSKVLTQWIRSVGQSEHGGVYQFAPWGRVIDPEQVAHQLHEHRAAEQLLAAISSRAPSVDPEWRSRWTARTEIVAALVSEFLADPSGPNEPSVAAAALQAVPDGGALVVSSSMPVRDVEWFGPDRHGIRVFSNRGANGIDGVLATAIGVATTGAAVVCLLGDIAFLHDASSLTALSRRDVDLSIVVVDNDGGGIFSALPQRALLSQERYEQLFGTPHGTDLAGLCAAHGIAARPFPSDPSEMAPHGIRVFLAQTDRNQSRALRDRIAALGS